MSDMGINQVLAQMRVMASAAGGEGAGADAVGGAADGQFAALMKQSIDQVSTAQTESRALADAFEAGDPSVALPEVMVALQQANLSFQAMSQVRNKLLSAYQEVMNMPV